MTEPPEADWREKQMRAQLEAELPQRMRRASRVQLQHFIPAHWFAAAASDCAGMYIAGFFYGAVSVAQAYVEALSRYLVEHHKVKGKTPQARCHNLYKKKILSSAGLDAARVILNGRDEFHHLNKDVEQDRTKLEVLAENCINHLHTIESEIFAHGFEDGKIVVERPEYWPSDEPGTVKVNLRQRW